MRATLRRHIGLCLIVVFVAVASPGGASLRVGPAISRQAARQALACAGPFVRTDLFFGSERPDGPAVSVRQFRVFLDGEITPRFPDGLTLLIGDGQFRNAAGDVIRETAFVLTLLYPRSARDSSDRIEEIRNLYKDRFAQESVLRVDSTPQRVCF